VDKEAFRLLKARPSEVFVDVVFKVRTYTYSTYLTVCVSVPVWHAPRHHPETGGWEQGGVQAADDRGPPASTPECLLLRCPYREHYHVSAILCRLSW